MTITHVICVVESDYKKKGPTMRCMSPIKAGFDKNGDITFCSTKRSKELDVFEFECRKCLPCRLNIAREKAVRSVHEARYHKQNMFLTLTYSDKHLKSDKLIYEDWQKFIKRLREKITRNVTSKEIKDQLYTPYLVTGEYGEKKKRPHWHAIIFNYLPPDKEYYYTTDQGETVYKSKLIDQLWGKNDPDKMPNQIGSVTMDSAGYVARYAAKKLVHGKDQDHEYHPIHKTSCKRAIGRTWIEKHWRHTFENGYILLPNGQKSRIPRYYVDWLKKHKWEEYVRYVNGPQKEAVKHAQESKDKENNSYLRQARERIIKSKKRLLTQQEDSLEILKIKFNRLQKELKL